MTGKAFLMLACLTALLPEAVGSQESTRGNTQRITAGLGVSYVGLGILGELKLGEGPLALQAGLGAVPGYGIGGASAGVRVYIGSASPFYVAAMGALAWGLRSGRVGRDRGGRASPVHL